VVHLERPVRAEGSVEVWLNGLLQSSQEAIHCIIRQAFHFINDSNFDLLEFVTKFQVTQLTYCNIQKLGSAVISRYKLCLPATPHC
jgi:hypothetical protein